jgi:diguanylate cyclase (GGDEF)-like protein/PAS domain S-box-containing protein
MVDSLPNVVIMVVDRDLEVLEITGGLRWQLDARFDDLVGRHITEIRQHPDEAPWIESYEKALAGERQHIVAMSKSGHRLETTISPLYEDGEITAAMAVVNDIDEEDHARKALVSTQTRAEAILATLHEALLVRDGDGRAVEWNQAFLDMWGTDGEKLRGSRLTPTDVLRPGGEPLPHEARPVIAAHRDGVPRIGVPVGVPMPDGTTRWLRVNVVPFTGPDERRWSVTTLVDVTDRLRAEHELMLAHDRLRALLEHSSELVSVIRLGTGEHIWDNGAWVRLLGWNPHGLRADDLRDRVHPDDLPVVRHVLRGIKGKPGASRQMVLRVQHADGSWRHFEGTYTNLEHDESVRGIVLNAHDVTDRVRAAAELAQMALHDSLTGLPNRRLVLDRIGQALEEQRRDGKTVAVFYLDLDDFKEINDSYGHARGDQLLVTIAHRLAGSVRAIDTVGRMGGDEFVIVAVLDEANGADTVARHISDAFREPVTLAPDVVLTVSVSVGMVASDLDEPRTAQELLDEADEAMYESKRRRRLRVVNDD